MIEDARAPLHAPYTLGALAALAAMALFSAPPAAAVDPPIANIQTPPNNATYDAGDLIVFSANFSTDPDGGPLYYIWTFPSEVIEGASAKVVNYTNFTVPGNYTVRLTVRDNESLEANATVTVNIRPPNLPPTALIATPSDGTRFFTNEFINFSGTGSSDPEGGPLAYFWSTNQSGQFGTGENLSVRLSAGDYTITLRVVDNRGGEALAQLTLRVEVNLAPHLASPGVSPLSGFDGDAFTFTVAYAEDNSEAASEVLLVLDGTPHPMQLASGIDPRAGQLFAVTLPLAPGRHAFYALASDGNLTNLSSTQQGPDVWLNLSLLSADGFAVLQVAVVPPYNVSIVPWPGAVPTDPAGLVPVSAAYAVNASAVDISNFTLTVSFNPGAQVNASSASMHRETGGAWLSLVTALDAAGNTATVGGAPLELPATFRVFARRAAPPPNAPPTLVITYAGEFYPNATVEFDASNSTDPEDASLLFAWRFEGPGLSTEWLPGARASVPFPVAGLYTISLRGDDGSGNLVYKNTTLEIRERPVFSPNTLEEPLALAGLALAVLVSAWLAVWWRGRRPARKRAYEDLYGRLYKDRMTEETEYTQLFEKYAEPAEAEAGSEGPAPPP